MKTRSTRCTQPDGCGSQSHDSPSSQFSCSEQSWNQREHLSPAHHFYHHHVQHSVINQRLRSQSQAPTIGRRIQHSRDQHLLGNLWQAAVRNRRFHLYPAKSSQRRDGRCHITQSPAPRQKSSARIFHCLCIQTHSSPAQI